MQGRCSPGPEPEEMIATLPPSPALVTRPPSQCLVIANGTVVREVGELWLDNVYIRNVYDKLDSGTLVLRVEPAEDSDTQSTLYMTGVTVQGNGNNTSWLYVAHAFYAQGAGPGRTSSGGEPKERLHLSPHLLRTPAYGKGIAAEEMRRRSMLCAV